MASNEKHSEAELIYPEWLNESFFENVLKNVEAESAKVTNVELQPGTLKNDHYASVLYRAKVKYRLQSQPAQEQITSFILKMEPLMDDCKKEVLGNMSLFQTEICMYTRVLPMIEQVLRQYGDNTILGPKLIASSTTSPLYVVFEDLSLKGYTTIGYRHPDLNEVRRTLLKLAKLHAVSYKLVQEGKNNVITSLVKGSLNSSDPENFPIVKNGIRLLKEVLSEHDDLKVYVPHIESVEHSLTPKSLEMFNAASTGKQDGIFVLNHGDFHLKNILIQKNDGRLTDLMLIDYQMSIYGSLAIDLHYAFTMMFSPEMRRDHHNELLNFYITNFQNILRITEYKGHIPSHLEIHQELKRHRYWGLYTLFMFLIFNYGFIDEDGDLAQLVENPEVQKKQLQDPKILNELREILPRLLHEGYFEL